MLRKQP